MSIREFASRDEFEIDDPRRYFSMEADYGVHWREAGGRRAYWRVSYIQDTGEVYAIEARYPFQVRVLGTVPADPEEEGRGTPFCRTLDRILDGWADPGVSGFDLAWVERRLARQEATP